VDRTARNFRLEITKAETTLVQAERLDEAAAKLHAKLRKFVADVAECYALGGQTLAGWREQASLPQDSPPVSIFEQPSVDLQHTFDTIARWLAWGKGIASAEVARLGATRKRRSKEKPAHNAAIWCLGAQVCTVVGRPHRNEVAELAQVILETEVSQARVRGVERKGRALYAEMIGRQTQRHFQEKIVEARRR
jgi:hypothetical protein